MISFVNEFEINQHKVARTSEFIQLNKVLLEIRDFIYELGFLSFGRDIHFLRGIGPITGNTILDSSARTMESIRHCCLNANFADAYTLLRKYRDDLFYYIYLFAVADKSDFLQFAEKNDLNKDEKNIWNWLHNQQKDLKIGDVLKCVASHPAAQKAVQDFKLKISFDDLAKKLNNYVHSNGRSFYNRSFDRIFHEGKVKEKCDEFIKASVYITMTFLLLLILISPLSIMSEDYTDYLDVGDVPPEDSQYWVAPFVSEFLGKYSYVLDEKCNEYLKEKTGMQI